MHSKIFINKSLYKVRNLRSKIKIINIFQRKKEIFLAITEIFTAWKTFIIFIVNAKFKTVCNVFSYENDMQIRKLLYAYIFSP